MNRSDTLSDTNNIKSLRPQGTPIFACAAIALMLSVPAMAQQGLPKGHPPIGNASATGTHTAPPAGKRLTGTVVETMDASSYTYINVDAGMRTVWAAAPKFPVKVGDRVSVPTDSPMQNYRSDTLARTFSLVYFAGKIHVSAAGSSASLPADKTAPHPSTGRAQSSPGQSFAGIVKADGGYTVGEFFDSGRGLAGQEIAVRGSVVKFSPRIMGTNWIHIQDGSAGADGSNDLIVTSDNVAAVGDVVLIRGAVSVDRDFGFGYSYALLVENASLTVE
jgi:hypothetical protein